ncbi:MULTISPECIES: anti-sigma factor domain-containing protein [unclassified Coleofasciculus]|uniref:anti-sigma factor n=1 Tax=unclassified Coleofasciculus TaxID=2692782 RepID=UPI001882A4F3|nr:MULTISPECIES: anti-sigma factor [unclassified Coleofasciculus]MBE9126258.1 anti-sigma factor [Coleofasciculus sp. LEGE 07081]MBE9148147.1 anti-sigma factor [Coleofasciculus sp. LEGE 07092]
MVDFQDSEELNELLASYVLGDLTPEEVASVNQLLDSNPELATEVSYLQKTLTLIPLSLPESSPPATLGSQILQAARDSDTSSTRRVSNRVWRRPKAWLGVAGSVAASVIVGLGLYSYRLHQELVTIRAELSQYEEAIALLRQPSNRLVSLKGTNAIPQASGSMVVVPSSEVAVLTLQNLAPLPKDQIYRLWAVADGQTIYCGEFKPDSQGKVFVELPLDNIMSGNSSVVVTVEPSQGLLQPTGETVMTGGTSL